MLNRIQSKVMLIIGIAAVILISGIIYIYNSETNKQKILFEDKKVNIQELYDKIVKLNGKTLEDIAYNEYSIWTEMADVTASKRIDPQWAKDIVNYLIPTYHFSAIWIYGSDFTPIYSVNEFNDSSLQTFPVPVDQLKMLFGKDYLQHFFVKTSQGVMEIRGASVHPSVDTPRKTPPSGYFIVGRLWNKGYIDELARLTGCSIDIVSADKNGSEKSENIPLEKGAIFFMRDLNGPDGNPVAVANVLYIYRIMVAMQRFANQQIIFLLVCSIGLFTVLLLALNFWINRPIRQMRLSMNREDLSYIKKLESGKDEFTQLAQLIGKFFEQRKQLLDEVEEHKHTEAKLRLARAGLEEWGDRLEERVKEKMDELRKVQENSAQSDKIKMAGKLASLISHDLKTPLTAIKNAVYYIKMVGGESQNTKVTENLELINKEVDECVRIIGDVLGFAKPRNLKMDNANPAELIKNVISSSGIPPNVQVVTNLKDDSSPIKIDSEQMRLVFSNIVKNALESMGGVGILTITLSYLKDRILIEFKDTGRGIPQENISRIFDPLFSTTPHGAGVGLSICHQIVVAHGGTIKVESELEKGSVFTIELPLDPANSTKE